MTTSRPNQTDLERLRQMEQEIERAQDRSHLQARPESEVDTTKATAPAVTQHKWGWGKTLGVVALTGGGLVVMGWILNLVGLVVKLALLGGGAYLAYRFVIAPKMRLNAPSSPVSELESDPQ